MTGRDPLAFVIRCDASHTHGMGHVVRCLALAEELRETHGARVVFAMVHGGNPFLEKGVPPEPPSRKTSEIFSREHCQAVPTIDQRGDVKNLSKSFEEGARGGDISSEKSPPRQPLQWLEHAVAAADARTLVLDVRDSLEELPVASVQAIRDAGAIVAVIDDPSERRLAADLAFYPPVPQVERMSWTGFDGELLVGWDWVLLRRDAADARAARPHREASREGMSRLLVTMGGSDPGGLTTLALLALAEAEPRFAVDLVLGPAFVEDRDFHDALARLRCPVTVHRAVRDLPALAATADLALASFGVTAYELAVLGVPALLLCLSDDHAMSASALDRAGMARSLGRHDLLSPRDIARELDALHDDEQEEMRRRGPELIDGLGARRIAAKLVDRARDGGSR
jgi:spore coat polysaccharide biosynthesis protein SpsF